MLDMFQTCCCGENEREKRASESTRAEPQPQKPTPSQRPQMNRGASAHSLDKKQIAEMNHMNHDLEPEGMQFDQFDDGPHVQSNSKAQRTEQPSVPTHCGCCPHSNLKPREGDIVMRSTWCCYCFGAGIGCHGIPDPLACRCNCTCLHCLCESSDVVDQAFGLGSWLLHCCFCTWISQLPPVAGTPRCMCCSEVCCGVWAEEPASNDIDVGKRVSVNSAGGGAEIGFLLTDRHVPLYCCCCGCTESLGRPDCFRDAMKCCCCRCVFNIGMPIEFNCNLLWTCHQLYCQCRMPGWLPNTPCCACCGSRVEHRRMSLYDVYYQNCRRCPACFERCGCCRCFSRIGYYCCPCCCSGAPQQQEMK